MPAYFAAWNRLRNARWLDQNHPALASEIKSLPWVANGIDGTEPETLQALLYIAVDSRSVVASIIALPWMQDSVAEQEAEAIDWLSNFSAEGTASSVVALVALDWMQDGIEELEVKAIRELSYIDYDDPEVAFSIVSLPWVRDSVVELELQAIDWMNNNFDGGHASQALVALGWIRDGIEELEVETIKELSYIAHDDLGVAESVVMMEWVQDGISDLELEAINWINNFGSGKAMASVVALDWVQDGIEELEVKAIQQLSYIDYHDSDQALKVMGMPFLETLDPADVSAIESLADLARSGDAGFQRVTSHPTLSNGITDEWTKIVATLYGVSKNNPALIDTLLDPDKVALEQRVIELPIAGETLLAIIRSAPGAERSMDLLEHAVHHHEEYMATSFPTGYVGWLFGDAVTPSFAGTNFGTHIASLSQYDVDDGSDDAEYAGRHSAHEVAHYYWRDNNNWVDEGIANFMEYISENARTDQPIEVTEYPCGYLRTIAELEALEVTSEEGEDSVFTCNYALGERLFLDLYRNLGADAFRQGLRNLYLVSQTVQEDDGEAGIEHVRTAFKDVEGVDDQVVDMITARWYEGTEPYDTSGRDTGPVNRRFVTVNGGIDVAYLSATSGGPPAMSFSARSPDDWVRIFLDYSYSVGNNTEVPLEIVTYFEDGFVFDRKYRTFTAEPAFIGGTWWLSVGVSPSKRWAPGQYRVYVYNEGRKLVELEYEVTE